MRADVDQVRVLSRLFRYRLGLAHHVNPHLLLRVVIYLSRVLFDFETGLFLVYVLLEVGVVLGGFFLLDEVADDMIYV